METLFAHTYLLLFGKLAVGGLLAMAVPPFHEMERGFYRSSTAVFLASAYAMAGGDVYLLLTSNSPGIISPTATGVWCLFTILFTGYFATLYIELPFLRARLFPAAVASGFVALAMTGWRYAGDPLGWVAGFPYAIGPMVGAAALGSAASGMLLGHWYLIDRNLDLAPLIAMHAFCRAALRAEVALVTLGALALYFMAGDALAPSFAQAFGGAQSLLSAGRVGAWALALILLTLIAKTLEIPQTMAATGLFYIQATTVAVGQILSHWLLFRTALPL